MDNSSSYELSMKRKCLIECRKWSIIYYIGENQMGIKRKNTHEIWCKNEVHYLDIWKRKNNKRTACAYYFSSCHVKCRVQAGELLPSWRGYLEILRGQGGVIHLEPNSKRSRCIQPISFKWTSSRHSMSRHELSWDMTMTPVSILEKEV